METGPLQGRYVKIPVHFSCELNRAGKAGPPERCLYLHVVRDRENAAGNVRGLEIGADNGGDVLGNGLMLGFDPETQSV